MATRLSSKQLTEAFITDLTAAWRTLGETTNQTPYAFVLYGNEGSANLLPLVLAEEGLTQVATRYIENNYHDTLDEARHALRYSVTDSPTFEAVKVGLPAVKELFAPHSEALGEKKGYEVLVKSAINAFSRLDQDGLFGVGPQREKLLLIIITDDTEEDWSLSSARKLNPPAVADRYEHHFPKVEGDFVMCKAVAISADRKSLYAIISRKNPEQTIGQEYVVELIASDIAGPNFERRWSIRFANWRDSRRVSLRVAPKEDVVYALRRSDGQTTVKAFAGTSDMPHLQAVLDGEPKELAVSADGSEIVAIMYDGQLHVLDARLNVVRSHQFDDDLCDATYIESGDVLLAASDRLLLVSPATGKSLANWPFGASRIRMDARQSTVVLSHSIPQYGSNLPETSVGLFRWPEMQLMHEIIVPGHYVAMGTVSPDARHLALHLSPIGKGITRLAVFDAETGKEIGRRKAHQLVDILFLDDKTLAMAKNMTSTNVPVERWRWRDLLHGISADALKRVSLSLWDIGRTEFIVKS